jgi:hypothetical protein
MSRRTRRLLLLLLAVAVLAVPSGYLLLPSRDARITWANCAKIKKGMTEQEVEAILGPPGNYTGWPHGEPPFYWYERPAEKYWFGEEALIRVSFDPVERTVCFAESHPSSSVYKDRRGRLLDWLRDLGDRFTH